MKIPKTVNTKVALGLLLVSVILASGFVYVFAATPSATFWLSPGIYPGAPSYSVWKEGSNYFAKNENGEIEFNGADASTVIQSAIDGLTANSQGGSQGKIMFADGLYNIESTLVIPAYSRIGLEGESTLNTYTLQWEGLTVTGGVLFKWTNGSGGDFLYCPADGTASEPFNMSTDISIENIYFRYPSRTIIGTVLNLTGAFSWRLTNVVCEVYIGDNTAAPVAGSIGVYAPHSYNERRILDNVVCFGFDKGYYLQCDHLFGTTVEAYYCNLGIVFVASSWGINLNYVHTLYCQQHIVINGTGKIAMNIQTMELEDTSAIDWITNTYGFSAPSGGVAQLIGHIGLLIEGINTPATYARYNASFPNSAWEASMTIWNPTTGTYTFENGDNMRITGTQNGTLYETFRFANNWSILQAGTGYLIIRNVGGSVDYYFGNGGVWNTEAGGGVILRAPNGNYWNITVDNTGTILSTACGAP